MYYYATIKTDSGPIHFEFEHLAQGTVVALDAKLDDFKAKPCKLPDGSDGIEFAPKTAKDCRNIDGCIYLHLGAVPDTEMVRLIEIFLKAIKDKSLWKQSMPNTIITTTR
jgi:hypothetical protein